MTDKKAGTGADVGFVKRDSEGTVTEKGGDFVPRTGPARWAYYIVYLLVFFALVGIYRLVELLLGVL